MTHSTLSAPARPFYGPLRSLCVASLAKSLNPDTRLFDRQLRHGTWQPTFGTEGLTSSCIVLIGVHRAGIEAREIGMDPAQTLDAVGRLARRQRYPGAAGLVLWAHAVWDALPASVVGERIDYPLQSLTRLVDRLTTMELAWLVSGLLHQGRRGQFDAPELLDLAIDRLLGRYSEASRLMWHAAPSAPLLHRLRRSIANFADQIYSVQALSLAALERDDPRARQVADQLSQKLVALQGPSGQWWWQYNAQSGGIAQHYPVYSVHQHGMAPMALLAAERACGSDLGEATALGQEWVHQNELGRPLIDTQVETIWRDIQWSEGKCSRLLRNLQALAGRSPEPLPADAARLEVNFETRPYEWAWCLYADAVSHERTAAGHIL